MTGQPESMTKLLFTIMVDYVLLLGKPGLFISAYKTGAENVFIFSNPIMYIDTLYYLTSNGREYKKNLDLAHQTSRDVIKQRKQVLVS